MAATMFPPVTMGDPSWAARSCATPAAPESHAARMQDSMLFELRICSLTAGEIAYVALALLTSSTIMGWVISWSFIARPSFR